MPKLLEGSCRCGRVAFSLASHTPYPYQLCYCSICRKTDGGGGFAINIMGDARTLKIKSKRAIGMFHARIEDEDGRCYTSRGERRFCTHCGTPLWVFDKEWPDLVHPFASAIDTDLPKPPVKTHLMLKYKASWVKPDIGPRDLKFQLYPRQSIEAWHRKHGLWVV